MLYTPINNNNRRPQTVITTFGGLQIRPDVPDGCWRDECNLSSNEYPRASVRRRRTVCDELDGNVFESDLVGTQTVRGVVAASGGEELVLLDEEGYLWCGGKYVRLVSGSLVWHCEVKAGGVKVVDESKALTAFGQTEGDIDITAHDNNPIEYSWRRASDLSLHWIDSPANYGLQFPDNPKDGDVHQIRIARKYDTKRSIVRMGAYAVLLPDKMYCNVIKLKTLAQGALVEGVDYGSWDHSWVHSKSTDVPPADDDCVVFRLCKRDGSYYSEVSTGSTPPASGLWVDQSTSPSVLRQYSAATSEWVEIPTVYVKIQATGIAAGLAQYDGVRLESADIDGYIISEYGDGMMQLCNGYNVVEALYHDAEDPDNDWIVLTGMIDSDDGNALNIGLTVERKAPELDFVVETGNRLWGCHYGKDASGQILNEIYACKLGDFRNWNCYEGISTDSYTASRGSDGPYTGAAVLDGHPLFFKESCVEKVFPSTTGAHQISTITLDGVEQGGDRSLVVIDNVLYYKSRDAVVRYTGTLPQQISGALGHDGYTDASAGRHGKQYRVMMRNRVSGDYAMYVYDTERGIWHREDAEDAGDEQVTVTWKDRLYITDPSGRLWAVDGAADSRLVKWYAESGEIGLSMPGRKWITRLDLRFRLELGAVARVYISYDGGPWHRKAELRGNSLAPSVAWIFPRRCDHLRIRLEGIGGCELQSMAYRVREGSEAVV